MEKTRLNLASGRMYLKDYLNVDNGSMNPRERYDLKADIFTLDLSKDRFDEILVCHFMMYVLPEQALELITRWHSWLKEGGNLIIETSDADRLAEMIIGDDENIKQMFGYGDTAGHKWSYTPRTIGAILREAGFKDINWKSGGLHDRPDRDFTITASK